MRYAKILVIFGVMFFLILGSDLTNAQQTLKLKKSIIPLRITAKLKALPSSYSGRCPTTIKFNGSITVSRATTNSQGYAEFSFVLNSQTLIDSRAQGGPPWPYRSEKFNFYMEETALCQGTSDWGNPDRWLWACPQGTRLVIKPGTNDKMCLE